MGWNTLCTDEVWCHNAHQQFSSPFHWHSLPESLKAACFFFCCPLQVSATEHTSLLRVPDSRHLLTAPPRPLHLSQHPYPVLHIHIFIRCTYIELWTLGKHSLPHPTPPSLSLTSLPCSFCSYIHKVYIHRVLDSRQVLTTPPYPSISIPASLPCSSLSYIHKVYIHRWIPFYKLFTSAAACQYHLLK